MLIIISIFLCLNSELIDWVETYSKCTQRTPCRKATGWTNLIITATFSTLCLFGHLTRRNPDGDWLWTRDDDALMLVPDLVSIPSPRKPQRCFAAGLLQVQFMEYGFHPPSPSLDYLKRSVASLCVRLFFLPYN